MLEGRENPPRLRLAHVTARSVWRSAIARIFDAKNVAKGITWPTATIHELELELQAEYREFMVEVLAGNVAGAIREAGDVLAYIAMLIERTEAARDGR